MKNRLLIALMTVALSAAACGSDESEPAGAPAVPTITAAPTTTPTPPTTAPKAAATTAAPTTSAAPAEPVTDDIEPEADADVDAIVEAYKAVFDSTTTYEEKAVYLVDPSGLEGTVAKYTENGERVGGVTVEVTSVAVSGDEAVVVYTLEFSGNPTYPGLEGSAVRTDAGWQITRTVFCGIMASAQSACPAQ